MKRFYLMLLLLLSAGCFAQADQQEFRNATKQWFHAWELLSNEVYELKNFHDVDFVFFDSGNVYSTSIITIPGGNPLEGNPIMKKQYSWKVVPHNGKIVLPDSSIVDVGLMSFASENKLNGKPFFVMPLPSFWKSAGLISEELGIDNLITGVFLHEFSHSQQMQNFGKKIAAYERNISFTTNFTDDIVQDLFKKDSSYVTAHMVETKALYDAAAAKDYSDDREKLQQVLMTMAITQKRYFKDSLKDLTEIDDFFLTMEGLGQYSMYAWLIHPRGASLPKDMVIKAVRRGKKQWSQDKGFGMFLLLDRYAPAKRWAPALFADETRAVKFLLLDYLPENK